MPIKRTLAWWDNALEKSGRAVYLIVLITMVFAFAVLLYFIVHEQFQISHQNKVIQQQRYESVLFACRDQNQRHQNTISALKTLLNNQEKNATPAQKKQIEASFNATVLIINAIVPQQNCLQIARETVTLK